MSVYCLICCTGAVPSGTCVADDVATEADEEHGSRITKGIAAFYTQFEFRGHIHFLNIFL